MYNESTNSHAMTEKTSNQAYSFQPQYSFSKRGLYIVFIFSFLIYSKYIRMNSSCASSVYSGYGMKNHQDLRKGLLILSLHCASLKKQDFGVQR